VASSGGKATLTLLSCTIANNSGGASNGGGLVNVVNSGHAEASYKNTIVADNVGPNIVNLGGTLMSLGHNLSSDGTGNLTASGDLPHADPKLGPLQNNGGPTPTQALLPGSPALAAGDPAQSGSTDQRGVIRSGAVNMGAYQASASSLALSGFPTSTQAGQPQSFTITLTDRFGQLAAGYRGTVHVSSTDGQAALPGDYPFGAADAGSHIFSATLKTAGSRSLTVADTVNGSLQATQSGIKVTPAPAGAFLVAGFPSDIGAGMSASFTVMTLDSYGNATTDYAGTVHFTSSDGQANLPGDAHLNNGHGIFNATLKTAGPQSIRATDTADSGITGSQSGIVVSPTAASVLIVGGFPSLLPAGTPGSVTVFAQDIYGNVATGYTGTVHFTSSDPQASLPGDSALNNGTGRFAATLFTAGTQSITATDTAHGNLTGMQAGILVAPAAASHFAVSTAAANPDIAGTPFDVTVTAQDAYGNTATGYTGTVHFTSGDPYGASLPADYTFQPTDQGVATFSGVTALYTAGTRDVTGTDTTSGISGVAFVNVQAAPAVAFQVVAPAGATSGVTFDVTVVAVDPYGNTDMNYTGTIHFTTSDMDPGVVLPPDYTFQASDAGMVTFPGGVTLITLGDQTLTATDTVSGITGTATVTVTSGAGPGAGGFGAKPAVSQQPPSASVPTATARPSAAAADPESLPVRAPSVGATAHRAALIDHVWSDLADPLLAGPWMGGLVLGEAS
jgi:hypothetical protein